MPSLNKTVPFLAAAIWVAGGLACSKPAPVPPPQPVKPSVDTSAQDKADADARQRAEADQKRKAEEAAEAARKAAALKDEQYRKAAEAALKDIHFELDRSAIREADKATLMAITDFMKAYMQANVVIDGNCDERGTADYNLALGDRRAQAAKAYLVSLGVPAARLDTLSYGKEKPVCTESKESCWSQNRRAHFALK